MLDVNWIPEETVFAQRAKPLDGIHLLEEVRICVGPLSDLLQQGIENGVVGQSCAPRNRLISASISSKSAAVGGRSLLRSSTSIVRTRSPNSDALVWSESKTW